MASEFHEAIWASVPEDRQPAGFALRRRFLLAGVAPGDRVLDIGCGDGALAAELARAGAEPIGVDVAEGALRRARAGRPDLDWRLAPIEGPLPVEDATVDVVWAGEVLEHVLDPARWLAEVRRVLRPGGRLLLTTPFHGRLAMLCLALSARRFERHFDPRGDHVRFFSRRSLEALLADLGFGDIAIRAAGGVPFLRHTLLASAVRRPLSGAAARAALSCGS